MVFGRSKNGQLGWPAGQSLRFTDHSITDILDLLKCTILKMKLYKKTGDRVDHLEKLFLAHGGIMKAILNQVKLSVCARGIISM